MKKKKSRILIFALILVCGILIFLTVFKDKNRLTTVERQWIHDNSSKVLNVHVLNDINIFGKEGKGLFYTFINDLEKKYSLSLNKIVFKQDETASGATFSSGNLLPTNAFLFYQDHYVLIGKNNEFIGNVSNLTNKKIGILNSNLTTISNYLKDLNISFSAYNTTDDLVKALDNNEVSSIITPRIVFLDTLLSKNYFINYHFSDIPYYYYMNDEENSILKSIMQKYFVTWSKENLPQEMAQEERSIFLKGLKLEEKDLVALQSNRLAYGLVNNSPYEVLASGHIGGIMTEYLKQFSDFSGIEIEYSRYKNVRKLNKEVNNNHIVLYMNYFTHNSNSVNIPTNIFLNLSIYMNESLAKPLNTLNALQNETILVEENTLLADYLSSNPNLTIKTYNRDKDWSKIIKDKKSIIAIDSLLGEYHSKGDLKKFVNVYQEQTSITYSLISLKEDNFNLLLRRYLNYLDNNQNILTGFYANKKTEQEGNVIKNVAMYAFYFLIIIGLILLLIFHNSKKVRLSKKIKKDDKLKYIDQLTSLKNRNYLNENMEAWNKNTVYPQTVIMIDLNRVQEINDTLGYEEGDRQIQGAANVLIRSQLDDSDVIRTDGNEFMIYLIGYNQKQITSYIHKLNKEFKKLPYDYGATIHYSMIENDLKDISDAINECVEEIKQQKLEQKEEKNENN